MLVPGDAIGDWIVEGRLGAGGMGTVYRCHNGLAERIRAAVKVLHPDDLDDFRERFVREVEALEHLEHPAIVRVKGWGEDQRGWLWLAMDLVEGEDLGQRLQRGPIAVSEAEAIFAHLADGLAHAHARNVFHRDIKPANILLQSGAPSAKLVDFGIAMQAGRTRLSSAGLVPGTPAYLAPEVFGGTPHPQLLDVYALGQVLYECLTGTPAFPEPDGMTTTARIAHVAGSKLRMSALDPGPEVPRHLRRLVRRATHPDPRSRVQDMETFASAVRGTLLEEPVAAGATMDLDLDAVMPAVPDVPPTAPEPRSTERFEVPVTPGGPRMGARLGLLAAGLLGLAALAVGGVLLLRTAPPTETRVIVTGVDERTPLVVRIDGERVEDRSGTAYRAVGLTGDVAVEVVGGEHCDLDAWSGLCDSCCGCRTTTVKAGEAARVAMVLPPAKRVLDVAPTVPGSPHRVFVDGAAVAPGAAVAFGTHTVVLQRGRCAGPVGCGEDCPKGCASAETELEVVCGPGPLEVRLDLAEPEPVGVLAETPEFRPVSARFPSIGGARIRLLHLPEELAVARQAASLLRAEGATVQLMDLSHSHPSEFGRVVFWDPKWEQAAHDIGELLSPIGYAKYRPPSKTGTDEPLDFAVWFKAP